MDQPQFTELIPGLPEEIALDCLTRLHYSAHRVASHVCKRWLNLLQSRDFYYHRKQTGHTHKVACLIQALPVSSESKPVSPPSYGITVFDPISGDWDRVDPIPKYPSGLPLFGQIASTEGKLYILGGWDPSSWEPIKDVFVYDFTSRKWSRCADMPTNRSFFAVGAVDGRIFIAGGHDENKNALKTAWVLDTKRNEWTELPKMDEERDECEGIIVNGSSEFWVVSGYDTDAQGRFKSSAECLDLGTHQWKRVEEAWGVTQCPRSCVGVNGNGSLRCWAESDSAVRVGACGIDLGEVAVVTGAAYQGGPHVFFLMDRRSKEGQNGKLEKNELPDDFCGFVQAGCCVEI